MGKIDVNTRVIGKCGNLLMLTNDDKASLDGFSELAFVVEKSTGKHITRDYPVDYLLRSEEDFEWTPVDEYYVDVYENEDTKNLDLEMSGLLGFAVGDALGVPVEFMTKLDVRKVNVQDMMGSDTNLPFKSRWGDLIPSGAWSDDTSMIYATMDSIVEEKGINYNSIMDSFMQWVKQGKYSSLDFPFGLGSTVQRALVKYVRGEDPIKCGGTGIRDNGNGALMRIFPFSLYCIENDLSEEETVKLISDASALTHGHDISKMSCFIYTEFMRGLIENRNAKMSFDNLLHIDYSKYFSEEAIDAHSKILNYKFPSLSDDQINGSGYVVDTLECAIYSIMNSNNYEDSVKNAINTGYDTDTIAGITGCLAGLLYGEKDIPAKWKDKLLKRDELELVALKFSIIMNRLKKNDDDLNEMLDANNDNNDKDDFDFGNEKGI